MGIRGLGLLITFVAHRLAYPHQSIHNFRPISGVLSVAAGTGVMKEASNKSKNSSKRVCSVAFVCQVPKPLAQALGQGPTRL
jgi:hypothetical protein